MKKTIQTYLYTILLFFIPFVIISFILAILSYFIPLNASFIHIIIQCLSYLLLVISALYFTSQIQQKRLLHCFYFSFIYFLFSLLIHIGNLHIIHLFLKSFLFLLIGIIKEIRKK